MNTDARQVELSRFISTDRTEGRGVPPGGWRYVLCSVCGRVARGGHLRGGGVMTRRHSEPGVKGLGHNCPGYLVTNHEILTPLYHELCARIAFLYRGELWNDDLDPGLMVAAYKTSRIEPRLRCGYCAVPVIEASEVSRVVEAMP